jgi:hypothetical protein
MKTYDWCQGELSKRGVVLAVDTLTLENGELNGLLVICLELVKLLLDIRRKGKMSLPQW